MGIQDMLSSRLISLTRQWPSLKGWIAPAALLLLSVFVLLPSAPTLLRTPNIDSGTSLYIGSRILEGEVPYQDIWDHKTPLVFFLNAFSLSFGQGRWGIWLLEVVSLAATSWMLLTFLRRYFGLWPSLFAVLCLLANLVFVLEYGNLPEEYGLLFQAVLLVCMAKLQDHPHSTRYLILMGIALGLSVSLKQTLVGTGIAVISVLLLLQIDRKGWRGLLSLLWIGAGFSLVGLVWVIYFAAQGALSDFWDQAFRYNLFYSNVSNMERFEASVEVIQNLFRLSWFFWLGVLAWLIVPPFLFLNEPFFYKILTSRWTGVLPAIAGSLLLLNGLINDQTGRIYALSALSPYRLALIAIGLLLLGLAFLFLSARIQDWITGLVHRFSSREVSGLLVPLMVVLFELPAQLLLTSTSQSNEYHSFLPSLPSITILMAFLIWLFSSGDFSEKIRSERRYTALVWLAILSTPVLLYGLIATIQGIRPTEVSRESIVAERVQAVNPEDSLLQWGMNSQLYFLTGRIASTRYLYQQPLFTAGYTRAEDVERFLSDLQTHPPAVIVDTGNERMPLVVPGNRQDCPQVLSDDFIAKELPQDPWDTRPKAFISSEMKQVYRWVCEHYVRDDFAGSDGWVVYRFQSNNSLP